MILCVSVQAYNRMVHLINLATQELCALVYCGHVQSIEPNSKRLICVHPHGILTIGWAYVR